MEICNTSAFQIWHHSTKERPSYRLFRVRLHLKQTAGQPEWASILKYCYALFAEIYDDEIDDDDSLRLELSYFNTKKKISAVSKPKDLCKLKTQPNEWLLLTFVQDNE